MSDPLWSNVSLLLHFDGADGSTSFIDETGKTITPYGGAAIVADGSAYGGSEGLFDGVNDYLGASYSSDFEFGSGDFCIESRVRFDALGDYSAVVSTYQSSTVGWVVQYNNVLSVLSFYFAGDSRVDFPWSPTIGQRYRIAVSRSSGSLRAFVEGVQIGTTQSLVTSIGAGGLTIGNIAPSYNYFNGRIDEVRITKGAARYTGDYTPLSGPFPGETDPLIDGLLSGQLLPSGASAIQVSNPGPILADMSGRLAPSPSSFISVFNPVEIDGLLSGRLAPSPSSRILANSFYSEPVYLTVAAGLELVSLEIKPVRVDGQLGLSGAIGMTSRQSLVVDGNLRLVNDTPCGCVNG